MQKQAQDLQVGDIVDLLSCPYLGQQPIAEDEYGLVYSTERETLDCVAIRWVYASDGDTLIDEVGYQPTQLFTLKDSE